MSEPTHTELLTSIVQRVDDKVTTVIEKLGKLEARTERLAAMQASIEKQADKLSAHEVRLTKIETKGNFITAGIAVVVSIGVGFLTALFKGVFGA